MPLQNQEPRFTRKLLDATLVDNVEFNEKTWMNGDEDDEEAVIESYDEVRENPKMLKLIKVLVSKVVASHDPATDYMGEHNALSNLQLHVPEPEKVEASTRVMRPRRRQLKKNSDKDKSGDQLIPFSQEKASPFPNGLPTSAYGEKLLEVLHEKMVERIVPVNSKDKAHLYLKEIELSIRSFRKHGGHQPVTLYRTYWEHEEAQEVLKRRLAQNSLVSTNPLHHEGLGETLQNEGVDMQTVYSVEDQLYWYLAIQVIFHGTEAASAHHILTVDEQIEMDAIVELYQRDHQPHERANCSKHVGRFAKHLMVAALMHQKKKVPKKFQGRADKLEIAIKFKYLHEL